jgi:Uma2 family endonuclease
MSVAHHIYTYDDLVNTPDDRKRYEIIGGELLVSPVPTLDHQKVVGHITVQLTSFVWERKLGQVYPSLTVIRLSSHNVVQPDALYISSTRLHICQQEYVDGAPDLILEVLSDQTRAIDLVQKRALYAMAGVPEYWIADLADHTISVLTLGDGEYRVVGADDGTARSLIVPGFEVNVAEAFASLRDDA